MVDVTRLSTRIDSGLMDELAAFLRRSGMKQQDVVQRALAVWLEDAEDLAILEERRERRGDYVPWEIIEQGLERKL